MQVSPLSSNILEPVFPKVDKWYMSLYRQHTATTTTTQGLAPKSMCMYIHIFFFFQKEIVITRSIISFFSIPAYFLESISFIYS